MVNFSVQYHIPVSRSEPINQAAWSFNKERVAKWECLPLIQKISYVVNRFFVQCKELCQSLLHQTERLHFSEGGCERFTRSKALNHLFTKTVLGKEGPYEKALLELRNSLLANTDPLSQRKAADFFINKTIFPRMLPEFLMSTGLRDHPVNSLASFVRAYQRLALKTGHNGGGVQEPFDAVLFGNVPYAWQEISLKNGKTCDLIRMPSVTLDCPSRPSSPFRAITSIEFQAFVSSLRAERRRHLYINLMSMASAHEKTRSQALSEYARTTNGALVFLSIDKNASFYKQKTTPNGQSQDEFFQQLVAYLKDTTYNELPLCVTDTVLEEVLSSVRSHYPSPPVLSRHERAVLIDLVHTELIQRVIADVSPRSVNISCKNCVDRGVAQQVELVAKYRFEKGRPIFTEDLSAVAFAPSLFVSNRPMEKDRFVRLVSVLDRFVQKDA